jgi:hypothetical protein
MTDFRITKHPILPIPERKEITFFWKDQELTAFEGETIASALFAHGIRIFGHHHKDDAPQGIFAPTGSAHSAWCWPTGCRSNRAPSW